MYPVEECNNLFLGVGQYYTHITNKSFGKLYTYICPVLEFGLKDKSLGAEVEKFRLCATQTPRFSYDVYNFLKVVIAL